MPFTCKLLRAKFKVRVRCYYSRNSVCWNVLFMLNFAQHASSHSLKKCSADQGLTPDKGGGFFWAWSRSNQVFGRGWRGGTAEIFLLFALIASGKRLPTTGDFCFSVFQSVTLLGWKRPLSPILHTFLGYRDGMIIWWVSGGRDCPGWFNPINPINELIPCQSCCLRFWSVPSES